VPLAQCRRDYLTNDLGALLRRPHFFVDILKAAPMLLPYLRVNKPAEIEGLNAPPSLESLKPTNADV
jgi:hypothetical protein